jgi:hypothetical protein
MDPSHWSMGPILAWPHLNVECNFWKVESSSYTTMFWYALKISPIFLSILSWPRHPQLIPHTRIQPTPRVVPVQSAAPLSFSARGAPWMSSPLLRLPYSPPAPPRLPVALPPRIPVALSIKLPQGNFSVCRRRPLSLRCRRSPSPCRPCPRWVEESVPLAPISVLPLSPAAAVPGVAGSASLWPARRRRSPSPCRPSTTVHGHVADRLFVPVSFSPTRLTPPPPNRTTACPRRSAHRPPSSSSYLPDQQVRHFLPSFFFLLLDGK